MSDKSTPRPWRAYEDSMTHDCWYVQNVKVREHGFCDKAATCYSEEDADLIVRAVNQYDHVQELVEAANVALAAIVNPQMFNLETVETTLRLALAHFKDGQS